MLKYLLVHQIDLDLELMLSKKLNSYELLLRYFEQNVNVLIRTNYATIGNKLGNIPSN